MLTIKRLRQLKYKISKQNLIIILKQLNNEYSLFSGGRWKRDYDRASLN